LAAVQCGETSCKSASAADSGKNEKRSVATSAIRNNHWLRKAVGGSSLLYQAGIVEAPIRSILMVVAGRTGILCAGVAGGAGTHSKLSYRPFRQPRGGVDRYTRQQSAERQNDFIPMKISLTHTGEDVQWRILRLRPRASRRWGKMPVALVLAHCTSGFQMAMGTLHPKRAPFPASLIGRYSSVVFGDDKPIRRNSPPRRNSSWRTPHSANSSANAPS